MKLSIRSFIPGIAWFFLLLVLLVLPGSDLPAMESWVDFFESDKLIHAALFGLLAYLFMRPVARSTYSRRKKWKIILMIVFLTSLWGIITEYIQKYLVTGRSFEWLDWVADIAGALGAMLLTKLLHLRAR